MRVLAAHERDGGPPVAGALSDPGQDVGEFGWDEQDAFGVGLRRGDLQQRYDLAGVGDAVGEQGRLGDLDEFLEAYAAVVEGVDRGPGPEGAVFGEGLGDAFAGGGVGDPDAAGAGVVAAARGWKVQW